MKKFLFILIMLIPILTLGEELPRFHGTVDVGYKWYANDGYEQVYGSTGDWILGFSARLGVSNGIYLSAGYYGNKSNGTTVGTINTGTTMEQSTLLLGGDYAWKTNDRSKSTLYIGGGYARTAISEEAPAYGLSASSTGNGWYGEFGSMTKVGSLAYNMVMRYTNINVTAAEGGTAGENPNLGGLSIMFGLGFSF